MKIKLHRNDTCYCGSNKKYKKCCLIKEEQEKIIIRNCPECNSSNIDYLPNLDKNDFRAFLLKNMVEECIIDSVLEDVNTIFHCNNCEKIGFKI